MKRLFTGVVPAIILFLTFTTASAQETAKWELIDIMGLRYVVPQLDRLASLTDALASASDRDFVVAGSTFGSLPSRIVRRTTDGGNTWSILKTDNLPSHTWNAVVHPDPNLIVIVGDSSVNQGWDQSLNRVYQYSALMLRSEDGGSTWSTHRFGSNTRFTAISMCNPQHGIILQANTRSLDEPAADLPHDSLLRTTDGWKTWTSMALPDGYDGFSQVICIQPDLYVVYAWDMTTGSFVTFRTTDGGATWQTSALMPQGLLRMTFLDPLNGWAAGGVTSGENEITDRIARTTDGGMTWTVVYDQENGQKPFGLMDIDFADASNGIAVGRENKILRTTDGGATWVQEFPPAGLRPQYPIAALEYVRPDFAIAVCAANSIIRYTGKKKLVEPSFIRPVAKGPQEVQNVTLEWTPVEGATGYHIIVGEQPVGSVDTNIYANKVIDQMVSGTSIVLNDLKYQHLYFARVQARNATLESDWHSYDPFALFRTKENADVILAPNVITPPHGALDQPMSLTITWQAIPGATSYDLQVGHSMTFMGTLPADLKNHTSTSYTVAGLLPQTTYFIRVRAHLPSKTTDWSSESSAHSFKTGTKSSSVEEELKANAGAITIFPNPVTDDAMVELHGMTAQRDARLEICNALGERVRIIDAGQSRIIRISTTGLAAGTYHVRLLGGAGSLTAPLVIVR